MTELSTCKMPRQQKATPNRGGLLFFCEKVLKVANFTLILEAWAVDPISFRPYNKTILMYYLYLPLAENEL